VRNGGSDARVPAHLRLVAGAPRPLLDQTPAVRGFVSYQWGGRVGPNIGRAHGVGPNSELIRTHVWTDGAPANEWLTTTCAPECSAAAWRRNTDRPTLTPRVRARH